MKAPLLIAALLLGTAAVAQTAPTGDANTVPATSPDPAAAPAMSATSSNAQAIDTSNYPVCSRTVTDKCVQRGAVHKAHRNH